MWDAFKELNDSEKLFKKIYQEQEAGFLGEPLEISQYETLIECYPWLPDFKIKNDFDSLTSIFKLDEGKGAIHVIREERYVYPVKHSHEYIEILCVCHGKCRHYVNDSCVEHTSGDICIIPPDVWHCTALVSDDSICFSIQVEKKFFFSDYVPGLQGSDCLSRFINEALTKDESGMYLLFQTGENSPLNSLILSMYQEACNRRTYSNEMLFLELNQLLVSLIRDYSDKSVGTKPVNINIHKNLYEMLDYMQKNYADMTLKKLAEKFNYNKEYLSRFFKLYTGKTFSEILMIIKMRNARDLVLYTQMGMTDISCVTGFFDLSHFYRCFKSYYGISPKQMRKNVEKNG